MTINKVNINDEFAQRFGLKAVKMNRLGPVVLIAGKNGCGKTRLFKLLKSMTVNTKNSIAIKAQYDVQKIKLLNEIKSFENKISSQEKQVENIIYEGDRMISRKQISPLRKKLLQKKQELDVLEKEYYSPLPIEFANNATLINIVDFVPKNVTLEDYLKKSSHEWKKNVREIYNVGVENLFRCTFPLLQLTQNKAFFTERSTSTATPEKKKEFADEFKRLDDLIYSFLGCHLGFDDEGNSTIFEYKLGSSMLSEGQSILIQLCAAIFCQGGSLNNFILFMDEPENHLHPSAVIDMLEKIRKIHPDGQFWIATHSIPLLSHFDPTCIWYIEDGLIRHAGKTPEIVLQSLLGNEEQIQKLRDFTSLPSQFATNRFAFECLLPPNAVLTDINDPQIKQIKTQLHNLWQTKETLRILDFGAGKGRMIANLYDKENGLSNKIDYFAFDRSVIDKDYCINNIKLSYSQDADKRYYNTLEELRCLCDDHTFDIVLLCNVLHEIPTCEWITIIKEISQLLNENGFLLIVEDCRLPVGELPHKNGFVVLNTLHLKKFFSIGEKEQRFIAHDARFDDQLQKNRLMAHLIPSIYLERVSSSSLKAALEELSKSALTNLIELRNKDATYLNGLALAFWTQQFANAKIALNTL